MHGKSGFLLIVIPVLTILAGAGSATAETNVSACMNLTTPNTEYVLNRSLENENVTDQGGWCIGILAENIILDCQGHKIVNTSLTITGIYSNETNTTIQNCNVTMSSSSGGYGIQLVGANDSYIYNNTLSSQSYGSYLSSTHNTTIENNTANSNSVGIYLSKSSDNNITDTGIYNSVNSDVYLTLTSTGNTFLSVNYSTEYVTSGCSLIRKWYYRAYVTYPSGGNASGVVVRAYNASAFLIENLTTNATGWTETGSLIDYVNSSGTTYYYSNYTINATHPSFPIGSKTYNVTSEQNNLSDVITLGDMFYFGENSSESSSTRSVAIADLDNDGDLDYIAGNYNDNNEIYLNNGTGHFTLYESSSESSNTYSVAIADLDNDGDLDYIAGNFNENNEIYLNNGTGHFTLFESSDESSSTRSVAIADLDLDGDPDYIAGNDGPNQIYLNNGTGHFTLFESSSEGESTFSIAIADLDLDGDPDYIAGNYDQPNRVYLNNGSAHFTSYETSPQIDYTRSASIGDLNNDGYMDYISANGPSPKGYDRIYLNNGTGHFTLHDSSSGQDSSYGLAIADLDNDGDLDYTIANNGGNNRIYLNDGQANFTLYENSLISATTDSVAIADLDNDGDLDCIAGNSGLTQNNIYFNNKNDNNYVLVLIKGTSSDVNRDGIGTKVAAYLNENLLGYREVTAADSCQDGTIQLHFGLSSSGSYNINATFITGKIVSCSVQPPINFTMYENGVSTNGVSCHVVDFPPEIVSMQPPDWNITKKIDVNFTCNVSDDNQLANVTIYLWNSTNDAYYTDTKDITGTQNQSEWFIPAMTPGIYQWNCRVFDNASRYSQQPKNYSLKVLIKNSLYVKLVINNTNNIVYIPGVGELNSSDLDYQVYGNPPHYYLASYLEDAVSGMVFSMQIPRAVAVSTNASNNTHYLALEQDMENSRVFLVFTLGNWRAIESRIALIEAGRFLTNILPSFSYGLGNKYSLDLALGYADIDLQGRLRLRKGSHKIVISNNGTSAGKPVIVIGRE